MEQPNLTYIQNLSRGDELFQEKLIKIIKDEFPKERDSCFDNLKNKDYLSASEKVHKLKHKISILGLEKSYEIAVEFENNLRGNNADLEDDFRIIMLNITNYLNML